MTDSAPRYPPQVKYIVASEACGDIFRPLQREACRFGLDDTAPGQLTGDDPAHCIRHRDQ